MIIFDLMLIDNIPRRLANFLNHHIRSSVITIQSCIEQGGTDTAMIERNIARLHAVKDFISEPNNRLFREDEPARTFSSDGILSDDQKQDAQTPWITIEDLIKQVTAHFDLLTFGSELSNNITTLETQMTASNPNATQEFFQWFNSTIQAIQFS